jgi:hypothetical protein
MEKNVFFVENLFDKNSNFLQAFQSLLLVQKLGDFRSTFSCVFDVSA